MPLGHRCKKWFGLEVQKAYGGVLVGEMLSGPCKSWSIPYPESSMEGSIPPARKDKLEKLAREVVV
eukprot:scaffold66646_cov15-Tisochrysis_lutea.AAC.1